VAHTPPPRRLEQENQKRRKVTEQVNSVPYTTPSSFSSSSSSSSALFPFVTSSLSSAAAAASALTRAATSPHESLKGDIDADIDAVEETDADFEQQALDRAALFSVATLLAATAFCAWSERSCLLEYPLHNIEERFTSWYYCALMSEALYGPDGRFPWVSFGGWQDVDLARLSSIPRGPDWLPRIGPNPDDSSAGARWL
jgi:hypothetical protein